MRTMLALAAVLLSLTAFTLPDEASAKTKGAVCASFTGSRQVGEIHPWYQPYSASRCFASLASCKAWLYKVQTAYPLMMDFTPCRAR